MKKIMLFINFVLIIITIPSIYASKDEDVIIGDETIVQKGKQFEFDNNGGGGLYTLTIVASTGSSSSSNRSNEFVYNENYETDGSGSGLGHVFLILENKSNVVLKVGNYNIAAKGSLSIGLWMNVTNRPHGGIWYNLELYKMSNNEMTDAVGLKEDITLSNITTIGNYISNSSNDWYDLITYNCTHFAIDIWNSVTNKPIDNSMPIPAIIKSAIIVFSNHQSVISVTNYGIIGYFSGSVFNQVNNPS